MLFRPLASLVVNAGVGLTAATLDSGLRRRMSNGYGHFYLAIALRSATWREVSGQLTTPAA